MAINIKNHLFYVRNHCEFNQYLQQINCYTLTNQMEIIKIYELVQILLKITTVYPVRRKSTKSKILSGILSKILIIIQSDTILLIIKEICSNHTVCA